MEHASADPAGPSRGWTGRLSPWGHPPTLPASLWARPQLGKPGVSVAGCGKGGGGSPASGHRALLLTAVFCALRTSAWAASPAPTPRTPQGGAQPSPVPASSPQGRGGAAGPYSLFPGLTEVGRQVGGSLGTPTMGVLAAAHSKACALMKLVPRLAPLTLPRPQPALVTPLPAPLLLSSRGPIPRPLCLLRAVGT